MICSAFVGQNSPWRLIGHLSDAAVCLNKCISQQNLILGLERLCRFNICVIIFENACDKISINKHLID